MDLKENEGARAGENEGDERTPGQALPAEEHGRREGEGRNRRGQDRRVDRRGPVQSEDEEDLVDRNTQERAQEDGAAVARGDPLRGRRSSPEIEHHRRQRDPDRGQNERRNRRQREFPEDRKESEAGLGAEQRRVNRPDGPLRGELRSASGAHANRGGETTAGLGGSSAATSRSPSRTSRNAKPRPIGPRRGERTELVTRPCSIFPGTSSWGSFRREPAFIGPSGKRNPT